MLLQTQSISYTKLSPTQASAQHHRMQAVGSGSCHPESCSEGQTSFSSTIYYVFAGRFSSWGKSGISGAGYRLHWGFSGQKFPMSVGKKSIEKPYTKLFSPPHEEAEESLSSWGLNSQHQRKVTGMSGVSGHLDQYLQTQRCRESEWREDNSNSSVCFWHVLLTSIIYLQSAGKLHSHSEVLAVAKEEALCMLTITLLRAANVLTLTPTRVVQWATDIICVVVLRLRLTWAWSVQKAKILFWRVWRVPFRHNTVFPSDLKDKST